MIPKEGGTSRWRDKDDAQNKPWKKKQSQSNRRRTKTGQNMAGVAGGCISRRRQVASQQAWQRHQHVALSQPLLSFCLPVCLWAFPKHVDKPVWVTQLLNYSAQWKWSWEGTSNTEQLVANGDHDISKAEIIQIRNWTSFWFRTKHFLFWLW